MTSWPAVTGAGDGAWAEAVASVVIVNELPESPTGAAEAGAEEGIAEFEVDMAEVAPEGAAEVGDDTLA